MRSGLSLLGFARANVGIIGAINRTDLTVTGDAALEMFLRFLDGRFLQRIGATAERHRTRDAKSSEKGFQELRITGEVTSDN